MLFLNIVEALNKAVNTILTLSHNHFFILIKIIHNRVVYSPLLAQTSHT